jgi:hypothetical protein
LSAPTSSGSSSDKSFVSRLTRAARRIHHDRLDAAGARQALDQWPPGIDVAAHVSEAAFAVAQVGADRAAAAGAVGDQGLDAGSVENAGGGGVDVGHHRRLHATQQHQHLARVLALGPLARAGACRGRYFVLQGCWQQRPQRLAELHRRAEQRRGQALLQRAASQALHQRALDLGFDQLAADVDQVPVLHAARAGALAVAAGQAAVEVQLRRPGRHLAFEHLLDQVDPPARPVELVAEQLVGRTGRGAEAAVHALAQDRLGGVAVGRTLEFGGQGRLHQRSG